LALSAGGEKYEMNEDELRITVCLIIAAALIFPSLVLLSSNVLFILTLGTGLLMVIYAFSPDTASSIINGIVKIVTAPFKR